MLKVKNVEPLSSVERFLLDASIQKDKASRRKISRKNVEMAQELLDCANTDFEEFKKRTNSLPESDREDLKLYLTRLMLYSMKNAETDQQRRDLYENWMRQAEEIDEEDGIEGGVHGLKKLFS